MRKFIVTFGIATLFVLGCQPSTPSAENAPLFNLEEVQNEIDAACDSGPVDWLPLETIETHKFEKGQFALLPLNYQHETDGGSVMSVKLFAVAVQLAGSDGWRGINMRVGLKGSPVEEARELLSQLQ